ncbi:MAG: P1 family peptidase [Acidimicrobiia bacterium]
MRAREYFSIGILRAGQLNAITDVAGVHVGHTSLQSDSLQTRVTVILPHGRNLYLMPSLPIPEVLMILRRHGVDVRSEPGSVI